MKHLWKIKDDKLYLNFHPGQSKAWHSKARFNFLLAGKQGGKTSFLPWWLYREAQNCGEGDYLAVTTTNDLFKLKFLPEMKAVFEETLGVGRYWAGDRVMELSESLTPGKFLAVRASDKMWGRIILRSAESKSGLVSATARAAILDEVGQDAWSLDDWEEILARLSLHRGRICGATSLYNLGWLKSEVYDPWLNGDPNYFVSQFASVTNPAFSKEEFQFLKGRMQDWRFSMAYLGQYAKPASLIYSSWDETTQLVDDFEIPEDWPRVVGVDFGGANTATLHLAESPHRNENDESLWYIYLETLEGGKSTGEHVEAQKRNLGDAAEFEVVGGSHSEGQQRMDWDEAGLFVEEPEIVDVESGIDRVTELLPRLRVFRSLRGLRDEFGRYQRKLDALGNPTDEIKDKRHFHRLDALRYAAIHIVQDGGVFIYVGGERIEA